MDERALQNGSFFATTMVRVSKWHTADYLSKRYIVIRGTSLCGETKTAGL